MSRPKAIARPPLREPVAARGGTPTPAWGRFHEDVGRNLLRVDWWDVTIDPPSIAAGATAEVTVAVAGLKVGACVVVTKPSHTAGVGIVNARVSGADTLAVTFMNAGAGAVDPPAETYRVTAIRLS